jgi:hypothetical protein
MAEEVAQWLAQEQNNRWLLIFDNIDKEPLDEGGFDIVPYFPPKDHGSVLITTCLAPLSRLGRSKRVGRMSKEEAVSLLDEILGEESSGQQRTWATRNQESPTTHELLETLDGLPLAMSQAGRFINTLNLKLETWSSTLHLNERSWTCSLVIPTARCREEKHSDHLDNIS